MCWWYRSICGTGQVARAAALGAYAEVFDFTGRRHKSRTPALILDAFRNHGDPRCCYYWKGNEFLKDVEDVELTAPIPRHLAKELETAMTFGHDFDRSD